MSMKVGGSKGGAIADINVTPMADIMIVLLIIFMVITPMLQKGVDVKLPAGGQHQGAEGRAEDDHGGGQEGQHHLPERHQDRQPGELVPQVKERLEDLAGGTARSSTSRPTGAARTPR